MFTLLMHIVIGLFTAQSYIVLFFKNARLYDLPEGNLVRKPENNSLGSLVPVQMLNFSGSYMELRGLTLAYNWTNYNRIASPK